MGPVSSRDYVYSPTYTPKLIKSYSNSWYASVTIDAGTATTYPTNYGTADDNATWADWYLNFETGATATNNSIEFSLIGGSSQTLVWQPYIIIGSQGIIWDPRAAKIAAFKAAREAKIVKPNITRESLRPTEDFAENKARLLLRSLIGAERFRRYMKDGFLSVKSPRTGLVYQVFPGHRSVVVFEDGKKTASCCIVFQDNKIPPTDWVVMRVAFLVSDEVAFFRTANVTGQVPERVRMAA